MPFVLKSDPSIHVCPFCNRLYKPRYATHEEAFATDDLEAREQHLSGCCSDACWDKTFAHLEEAEEEPSFVIDL